MSRPETGPIWFLSALLVVHILAFTIMKLSKDKDWILLLILIGLFAGFYFYYKLGYEELWFNADVACMALIFFSVGYILKKNNKILHRLLPLPKIKLIVLFFALSALNISVGTVNYKISDKSINMWNCNYCNPTLMLISAFCGIFAIIIFSNLFTAKSFVYCGKSSMTFFIPHKQIEFFILRYIWPVIGFEPDKNLSSQILNLTVLFLFITILLFVVNEIFIRTPFASLFGVKRKIRR